MAKLTLGDILNLNNPTSAVATINNNSNLIEQALENTLSRDGTTPNQMEADLDMNSNRVVNLPRPVNPTEPARLSELQEYSVGSLGLPINNPTFTGTMTGLAVVLNKDGVNNEAVRASQLKYHMPSQFATVADLFAAADSTGWPIVLPPGRFVVPPSTTLNSPLTVFGAGPFKTTLEMPSLTQDGLVLRSPLGSIFCDLTFEGPNTAGVASSTSGALLALRPQTGIGAESTDFRNVRFLYGYNQLDHSAGYNTDLSGCDFFLPASACIVWQNTLASSLGRSTIRGCKFVGASIASGFAFYWLSGNTICISDCIFSNIQYGIVVAPPPGASVYNLQVSNCVWENIPYCVRFIKGTSIQQFNFNLTGCHLQGTNILSDDGGTNWNGDTAIVGNTFFPVDNGYAIDMNANALVFVGNMIDGGGFANTTGLIIGAGSFNWIVSGNAFTSLDTTVVNNSSNNLFKIIDNVEHIEGVGPPPLAIQNETVGTSPWVFGGLTRRTRVYARSGTVSLIEKKANYGGAPWVTIGTSLPGTTPTEFTLEPFESLRFTYTVAPAVQSQRLT